MPFAAGLRRMFLFRFHRQDPLPHHEAIAASIKIKTAQTFVCAVRDFAFGSGADAGHGHAPFAGLVAGGHGADPEGVQRAG